MQRFWSSLAVQLGKHAVIVTIAGLLVTIGLGLGISQLKFATGQDAYLNKDDQVYKDNVAYQQLFGGTAVLGVITMQRGHTVAELFRPEAIAEMERVHDELVRTGRYPSVVTPLLVVQYTDVLVQGSSVGSSPTESFAGRALLRAISAEPPGSTGAALRSADSARTLQRISAVRENDRRVTNPDWLQVLLRDNTGAIRLSEQPFIPDDRHAVFLARLQGNLKVETEGDDANFAKQRIESLSIPNATVVASGPSILIKDINDYLRGGMLLLGAIAVAIMILILLLLFQVRWRLLPMLVILVGVVWAFGVAGYVGIPLTVVTIAGLPVMLGVGIDYAIQMHARVEEEVVVDRSDDPIQETARSLGPALLVVTFDAVFAFLALRFAKVPMIRDFGLLLAVGIAVICVASIILPLAILSIREHRSPTKGKDFREGPLGRATVRLGSLPQRFAVPLAVLSVALFAGGILVEGKLQLQTDPVQWVNQTSGTINDIHALENAIGASSELGVFVSTDDVFSDANVTFMHDLLNTEMAEFGPGSDAPRQFTTASSMERIVGAIMVLEGASDVVPTGAEVHEAYDLAPPDIKDALISLQGNAANMVFAVSPGGLDDLADIVSQVGADIDPPAGVRATPSGLAVVGVGLLHNLESNRVLLTYLAMLFVFAFLAVRLRSVIRSLLSLVPVAIAVGSASIVAYVFNLQLSPMTAVGGPLVIAACTEFTSLILLRFVEERGRGIEPQEAVHVVAARTGRAFIVSGLTAIAGVAVLSFSSLPLLRDFGRIVAMNVAVALLSALIVLPPLLVWAERRGWVCRGLIKKPSGQQPTPAAGGD